MDEPLRSFTGGRGIGDDVQGPVLVTRDGFSPRYDLDRTTGVISRVGHDLEGQSIAGSILVIDRAKGGVAAGWALRELAARGFAPLAMAFDEANPVFVQGCALAGIPIVEGLNPCPSTSLRSGQMCKLSARGGRLEVIDDA